jgi:hypothetical protein
VDIAIHTRTTWLNPPLALVCVATPSASRLKITFSVCHQLRQLQLA